MILGEHQATTVEEMASNTSDNSCVDDMEKRAERLDWELSSKLYDREAQLQALSVAYRQRLKRKKDAAALVLITGSAGTGKSALARSISTQVEDDWGYFLIGQFDPMLQKPHAPFLMAVEEWTKQLPLRGDHVVQEVRDLILDAMESEVSILVEAIPPLQNLLQISTSTKLTSKSENELSSSDFYDDNGDKQSTFQAGLSEGQKQGRFARIFCQFLKAICSCQRPLVLLLDDLQWADASSLEVLYLLLNNNTISSIDDNMTMEGLMIIGTCRDNEIGMEDDLSIMLRKLEDQGTTIAEIKVGNMTIQAMSDMICSALDFASSDECMSLAEIVHSQTHGNVFFVKQYLKSLLEEGILRQDHKTQKWEWDEAALILSLPASEPNNGDLVVQLLAKKLQQLPRDAIDILKVMSCMGSRFTEEVLYHTGVIVSSQVLLALEVAATQGIIVYDVDHGRGRFAHDRFREAAYSMIPGDEKAMFHLTIGRNLRRQLSLVEVKRNIFWVVDQFKNGLALIEDSEERDDCSRLFLRASREAAKAGAFQIAMKYVDLGMDMLNKRHWRDQYELSLDLYSTAAELAYCIGKHDMVGMLAEEVVENARSIGDKSRAMMAQIVSLGSRGQCEKGIDICLNALRMLNEPYPRRSSKVRILLEFFRTKRALDKTREEDILSLPRLVDPRAMASMQIIFLLFPLIAFSNLALAPLSAFRLIRLTLKYGLSSLGGVGFLLYAGVLVRMGNIDDAYRFGSLALEIMERYPAKQLDAKIQYIFCVSIQALKEPFRTRLDPLMNTHCLGMRIGDVEIALAAGAFHAIFRLYLGDPLCEVFQELAKVKELCINHCQLKVKTITSCAMQLCQSLQGFAKDPLVLTGGFLDEVEVINQLKASNLKSLLVVLLNFKFLIATFMNENKYAEALYRANKVHYKTFLIPFLPVVHQFFRGLVSAALARECTGLTKRRKLSDANTQYKRLQSLLVHCPDNIINKLYLIDAEVEFCRGRYSTALLKYNKSISYAERYGFISECALACEKAGIMLLSASRQPEATTYLERARSLYVTWGAHLKVDQTDKLISTIVLP